MSGSFRLFSPVPPRSCRVLRVSHVVANTGPGVTALDSGEAADVPPTLDARTLNR